MRLLFALLLGFVICASALGASAEEDPASRVRSAMKKSSLDQPGTKPFHLRAEIAPSHERDAASGRTGQVEIWWTSPMQFREEVSCPEFHQVQVVNGDKVWQKREGDYFPEWLRETATALIRPMPYLDETLAQVKDADTKRLMGSTYYSWSEISTDGTVQKGMGASVALTDSTGLLFYAGGVGWGGLYKDYQKFHDRMVARTVTHGSPEVTAKIVTLEDLNNVTPSLFDVSSGGDDHPIKTVKLEEVELRKHLLPGEPIVWPVVQDGPLEGTLTTSVVIDRQGAVREVGTIVSDNQAMNESARKAISSMHFSPYVMDGNPVQVISRITMPFKATRPAGSENFDSAKTYFEHGRSVGFPANSKAAYRLTAEFQAGTSAHKVEKGEYKDIWLKDEQWRREAHIADSQLVRTRNEDKRFKLAEGPNAGLLTIVMHAMEPIPAMDTFYEGDWHVQRDTVDGVRAVRVLTGYVKPDGSFDQNVRAFWFNDGGDLVKVHINGLDIVRSDFENYNGTRLARRVDVLKDGTLGMRIQVVEITPAAPTAPDTFMLKGHEWTRAFTDEVR
jgi:Gram-negative bacterial TonB protein C-terminal